MDWNYRVFQETNGDYVIREVFYGENGLILGCTAEAVEPSGRSLTELARDLESFMDALTLPTLTLEDIPTYRQPVDCQPARRMAVPQEQLLAELSLAYSSCQ